MIAFHHPGLLLAAIVLCALLRLLVLLTDIGPGRDISGMWLCRTRRFGVTFHPMHWEPWPFRVSERAEWPRIVTVGWLMFIVQWEYSPSDTQSGTKKM